MEVDQSADKRMPQGLDEEDEEEMELRKDAEQGKFTLEWKNLEKVPATEHQKVVIANSTNSKALLRILHDDKLEEIASAEVSTEESKKPDTVLKLY